MQIKEVDGEYLFSLNQDDSKFKKALRLWSEKKESFETGEIEEDEYNLFRYAYTDLNDEKEVKERVKRERRPKKEADKKDEYWLL